MKKDMLSLSDNDFGFIAVSENELTSLKQHSDNFDEVIAAMLKLVDNLMKNPEKDYFYWPNRVEKLTVLKNKILELRNGE